MIDSWFRCKTKSRSANPCLDRLNATDPDRGDNGAITYSLLHDEVWGFSVDSHTGQLYVHSGLDREKQAQFKLYVLAKDRGRPHARTSTATVNLLIDDVNDEAPHLQNIYRYHILENMEPDVRIRHYSGRPSSPHYWTVKANHGRPPAEQFLLLPVRFHLFHWNAEKQSDKNMGKSLYLQCHLDWIDTCN